jgi:hypothetical protein
MKNMSLVVALSMIISSAHGMEQAVQYSTQLENITTKEQFASIKSSLPLVPQRLLDAVEGWSREDKRKIIINESGFLALETLEQEKRALFFKNDNFLLYWDQKANRLPFILCFNYLQNNS